MVEHVESLVPFCGELEPGAVPFVRDSDHQLVGELMPEQYDLDAVVLSVGKLSIWLSLGECVGHGCSFVMELDWLCRVWALGPGRSMDAK
jgi:hypothetical protein